MSRCHVFLVGMAGGALLDGPALDFPARPLPGVNAPVAVDTAKIFLEVVEIAAIFPGDLLVTHTTGNGRGLVLTCHVAIQVLDIGVAAAAAVIAVDRGGKGSLKFRVFVTTLAGPGNGRIGSVIKDA